MGQVFVLIKRIAASSRLTSSPASSRKAGLALALLTCALIAAAPVQVRAELEPSTPTATPAATSPAIDHSRVSQRSLNRTIDPVITDQQPTIDLPYLPQIVLDGDGGDWGDAGYIVAAMIDDAGQPCDPASFSCRFRLAWDDLGILVLGHVTDDQWIEFPALLEIWKKDGLEMFLAQAPGSDNYFQALIAPGMAEDQPQPRGVSLFRGDPENKLKLDPPTFAVTKQPGGYSVEAHVPFCNLGLSPKKGDTLGFQLFFDDADHADFNRIYPRNVVWFPSTLTYLSPLRMHRVRLSDKPSPPVLVAASGFQVHHVGDTFNAVIVGPLPGDTIEIRKGDDVYARAEAPAGEGRHAITMTLTKDLGENPMQWMTIQSGGQEVGTFLAANEFPEIRGITRAKFDTPEAAQLEARIEETILWTNSSWPQRIINYKHTPAIGITILVIAFLAATCVWVYRSRRLTINDI